MSSYFPLKVHTHFSLSLGLSMPKHVAKRCANIGLAGAAMTDYNSISGSIDFLDAMGGKKLKGIIGCELAIVNDYESKSKTSHTLLLLAKNYEGWTSLANAISEANRHYWGGKPHITIEDLARFIKPGTVFFLTGWFGSTLTESIISNTSEAYLASSYENAKKLVDPDWVAKATAHVEKCIAKFGKENFYLGLQLIDAGTFSASRLMAEGVKYLARKTGVPLVALPDSYYAEQEDAYDQRVLLANYLDVPLKFIHNKPVQGDDVALGKFFNSTNYHIPTYDEMVAVGYTPEQLELSVKIAEQCTDYKLTQPPMLPQFPTPNGETAAEYLRKLCDIGWERRWPQIQEVIKRGKHTEAEYRERLETEFEVLTSVGLADYFLIVEDFIKYARNDGQLTGAGRGSAAGSLILYLLGVTHVDPIEYDLLFERFYNAGRNTPGNISLPDVDMDFEKFGRERVVQYARMKYGQDRVAQMITFNRMQGRGAIKDVLRAHNAVSNEEANRISKLIPDEAEISDQLEIIREADKQAGGDGEASIIEWALDAHADDFKEWVWYDDKEQLQGPLSKIFEQAIRMEGTKRASGKHAAGIVISQVPLSEICPMSYDEATGEMIASLEMGALEKRGQIKFDFLAIASLDKIHAAINHLRTGKLFL